MILCFVAACSVCAARGQSAAISHSTRIDLADAWSLQSSAKVTADGAKLSSSSFRPSDWYRATMPSTVLAALVKNKVYPDPCFGMNLRTIPGASYPIATNFSNAPMPADSPFAVSWWYRKQFTLPVLAKDKRLWLNFDSINYRANIWLNGHRVESAERALGMYRMFSFDITGVARPGKINTLAVEVFPPTPTDLSITFVDWNPLPPDKDMGLVRDVYLLTSGPVAVGNSQVVTKLDPSLATAHLTVAADIENATNRPIKGTLRAEIGDIVVSQEVTTTPGTTVRVEFAPHDFPRLNVSKPQLWWPYPYGPQTLQKLHVSFVTGAGVSDEQEVRFGIREITSEIDAQQHRLFKVNGKPILIRGGGWSSDIMLRFSPEREEDEIRYVRDMHLNTIRLEGKMMNDHFFETCDRYGILVMAGWCCCSYWERWEQWKPSDYVIAGESLRDQVRRIRNHPSLLAFLYGSDNSPNPQAESVYLKVLQDEHWPNPSVSSAADRTTSITGITGVKMTGPYEYVAPNYWLFDHEHGGAFGFNTETSPGPAIPEMASLHEMLPSEHLWPIDEAWNFHAGGGAFSNVKIFTDALEGRYGKARNLEDYVRKSQIMTYEGERAMFEAYGRNKYAATGVIQWMLNNSWPSIIWHLYDYYLRPGGGYFGTKKACEPLHAQYSYDDRSVVIVNSFYRPFTGCTVTAKVYDLNLSEKFSQVASVDVPPDSAVRVMTLPNIADLAAAAAAAAAGGSQSATTPSVYFVRLSLTDGAGKLVGSNFYWLSTQPDISDWEAGDWNHTPIKTYANMTDLEKLPPVTVSVSRKTSLAGSERTDTVTVKNPTTHLAFFIHLRLLDRQEGKEIAPVLWDDNYFELMPGETRQIRARTRRSVIGSGGAALALDGLNVAPVTK